MSRARFILALLLGGAAATPVLTSCTAVAVDDRFTISRPTTTDFDAVSNFLVHRCGSLDCHGQIARNLRLYGKEGLRLAKDPCDIDAGLDLGSPGIGPTTACEREASYRSIVALEPELTSQVVQEHGAQPDRLTLIRKPRGTEDHKGGQLWSAGDVQDRCVVSWLGGKVDTAACKAALKSP